MCLFLTLLCFSYSEKSRAYQLRVGSDVLLHIAEGPEVLTSPCSSPRWSLACWLVAVAPGFTSELYPGRKGREELITHPNSLQEQDLQMCVDSMTLLHNVQVPSVPLRCPDLLSSGYSAKSCPPEKFMLKLIVFKSGAQWLFPPG